MPIIIYCLILVLSPTLFAQTVPSANALSFAPPPSDSSMIYLSNIFGNVEGVLASTGSQILGQMMSILNMAILSVGSIVIMYALVIGTLNTAHEGEFLGRHWSSIWLPVRCCTGLALLVPKASGYNLIQIFIMWFIVQGVGAADKVWNAALDYMNEGGQLIVAKQTSSSLQQISEAQGYSVYKGAIKILGGQVCMEALQRAISTQRASEIKAKDAGIDSNCSDTAPDIDTLADYCNKPVPDFIGSVNISDAVLSTDGKTYTLPMPNLKTETGFYASLNGVCGTLKWNVLDMSQYDSTMQQYGMTKSQIDTLGNSRNIAIQQMYDWLSSVAIQMVNNDPKFNDPPPLNSTEWVSAAAKDQFGFALQGTNKTICTSLSSVCTTWGAPNDGSMSYPVLFTGNEFSNAIATYDGVMGPTLNLIHDIQNQSQSYNFRNFIDESKSKGWLMAGSYFYNLIALSGSKAGMPMPHDANSGLEESTLLYPSSDNKSITLIFKDNTKPSDNIQNLIIGLNPHPTSDNPSNCGSDTLKDGTYSQSAGYISSFTFYTTAACASTVYGFIGNSYFLYTPGEPLPNVQFANPGNIQVTPPPSPNNDLYPSVPCHQVKFLGCIKPFGAMIIDVFNSIYLSWTRYIAYAVSVSISEIIIKPLITMGWPLIQYALDELNKSPSLNPIVNLGYMGVQLVNNIMTIYIVMLTSFILTAPVWTLFGIMSVIIAMAFPLIASFFVLFTSIGFICAYYVPLIPYMIFTFSTLSWFMAVIEAMVAGPILALGVMSPEGEGILGKAEQGMMILVNVFLRPSMMIIGFVMGAILTYVFVWVLSEGYSRAADYLLVGNFGATPGSESAAYQAGLKMNMGTFSMVFGAVTYSVLYVYLYQTVVEKSFELIHLLPDQILRWIGGHGEQYGREAKDWGQGGKEKLQKMEDTSTQAIGQSPEKGAQAIADASKAKKAKLEIEKPDNANANADKE